MSDLLPKASSFSRRVECTLCGIGPDNAGIYKINGDVGTLALADLKSTNTIVRVDNRATYNLNGIKRTPGTTDCFNIELNKAAVPEEDNEFDIDSAGIDGALQYLKDNKIVASSFSEAVFKVMKLDSIDPKVAPLLQLPLLSNLNEGKRTAIFDADAVCNPETPSPLFDTASQESLGSTALRATVSTETGKQELRISEISGSNSQTFSWTKGYYCLHPTKSQFAQWSKNSVTFYKTLNEPGEIIETENLEITSVALLEVELNSSTKIDVLFVAGKHPTDNIFYLLVFNLKDNIKIKLYKLPGMLYQMYLSRDKALVFQYEFGVTENAWTLRRNDEAYIKAIRRDKNTPALNMPLFDEEYLFNPEKETSAKLHTFITDAITRSPKYVVTALAICDKLCAAGYNDGSLVTFFFEGAEFKLTRLFYTGIVSMAFAQIGTDTYLISASNEDLQIDKVDVSNLTLTPIFRAVLPTPIPTSDNTILQMVAFKQRDNFVLWVCRKTDLLQYMSSNISGDNPTLSPAEKISEAVIACAGSETHSVFATKKELFASINASISPTTTKITPDYLDGSIVDVAVTSIGSNFKFVVLVQDADKFKAYVIDAESFEKETEYSITIDETSQNYRLAIPLTITTWDFSFVAKGDVFATGYFLNELLRIDRSDVKSQFYIRNLPSTYTPSSSTKTVYNRADLIESNLDSAFLQLQGASAEYYSDLRQLAAGYDGPQEIESTFYDLTKPENEMFLLQKEALDKMNLPFYNLKFPTSLQELLYEFYYGVAFNEDEENPIFADTPMNLTTADNNAWQRFKEALRPPPPDANEARIKCKLGTVFLVNNTSLTSNLPCGTYVYFLQKDDTTYLALPVRACEIFKISNPLGAKQPHATQAFLVPLTQSFDQSQRSHFIVNEKNQIFSLKVEPTKIIQTLARAKDIVKNAYVDVIESAAQMLENFEDIKGDVEKIAFDPPLTILPAHREFNQKVRDLMVNQYTQLKETDDAQRDAAIRFFEELRTFFSDFDPSPLLKQLTGEPTLTGEREAFKLLVPGESGFALSGGGYDNQQFLPADGTYKSILDGDFMLEFDLQADKAQILKKQRSLPFVPQTEIATVSRSGSNFFLSADGKTDFITITALKDIRGLNNLKDRHLLYEVDAGKNQFELVQVVQKEAETFMVWKSQYQDKEYTHILVGHKYFLLPKLNTTYEGKMLSREIIAYDGSNLIQKNTAFATVSEKRLIQINAVTILSIPIGVVYPTIGTTSITIMSYNDLRAKEKIMADLKEFTATAKLELDFDEFKFINLPSLNLGSYVLYETGENTQLYNLYKVEGSEWVRANDAERLTKLEKTREYIRLPPKGTKFENYSSVNITYENKGATIKDYIQPSEGDGFDLDKKIIRLYLDDLSEIEEVSYNSLKQSLNSATETSASFVSLPSDTGSTPLVLPEHLTLLPNFASMQLFSTATKALAFMAPFSELGPGKICDREGAVWFGKTGYADCVLKDAARFPNCLQPSVYAAVNQGAWGSPLGYTEPTQTLKRTVELVDGLARTLPSSYVSRLASFVFGRHKTDKSKLDEPFKNASYMIIWLWHSGKDLLENYAECNFYLDPALQLHQCAGKSELPTPNSCNLKLYWTHQRLFDTGRLAIDARSSKKDILNFWVAHWALMIEPLPPLEPTTNVCNRIFQYVGPNLNRVLYCKGSMVCLGSLVTPATRTVIGDDLNELFAESRHNLHLRGLLTENNYNDRLVLQFDKNKVKNLYMRIVGSNEIDPKIKYNNSVPDDDTQKSTIKALTLHGLGDIDVINV